MTTVMQTPKLQFFTAAGVPLAGGKLYTYAAGTTTPLATYTDYAGFTPNANPIILDSRGECNCWTGDSTYKLVLRDSSNNLIWSVDNVGGVATLAYLASSDGAAAVGFLQSGTGAVLETVEQKLRLQKHLFDFCSDAKRAAILVSTSSAPVDVTAEIQLLINAVSPINDGTYQPTAGIAWLPDSCFLKVTQTIDCTTTRAGAGERDRTGLRLAAGSGCVIIGETAVVSGSTPIKNAIIEVTGSQFLTIDRGIHFNTTYATANKSTIGIYQGVQDNTYNNSQTQNQKIGCRIAMHDDATANGGQGTIAVWNFGAEECTYDAIYWSANASCLLTSSNDGNQPGQVNAGSFVPGMTYVIKTVGTTSFTSIGAASNTPGVRFVATGAGTGSGVAAFTPYSYTAALIASEHSLGLTTFAGECFLQGVELRNAQLILQNITTLNIENMELADSGTLGSNLYGILLFGNVSASRMNILMEVVSSIKFIGSFITSELNLTAGGVNTAFKNYPVLMVDRTSGSLNSGNGIIDSVITIDRQAAIVSTTNITNNGDANTVVAAIGPPILSTVDLDETTLTGTYYFIADTTITARRIGGSAYLYIPRNLQQASPTACKGNRLYGSWTGAYSSPTFAAGLTTDTTATSTAYKTGDGTFVSCNTSILGSSDLTWQAANGYDNNNGWQPYQENPSYSFQPAATSAGVFTAPMNMTYHFDAKVALNGLITNWYQLDFDNGSVANFSASTMVYNGSQGSYTGSGFIASVSTSVSSTASGAGAGTLFLRNCIGEFLDNALITNPSSSQALANGILYRASLVQGNVHNDVQLFVNVISVATVNTSGSTSVADSALYVMEKSNPVGRAYSGTTEATLGNYIVNGAVDIRMTAGDRAYLKFNVTGYPSKTVGILSGGSGGGWRTRFSGHGIQGS